MRGERWRRCALACCSWASGAIKGATFVWVARRFPLKSCFLASEVRERVHGFGGAERLVFSSAFRLGWSGASAQLEDSPSGLWRTLGKRVGCKPSGVRIPHPPRSSPGILGIPGFFVVFACPGTLRGERVVGERVSARNVCTGAAGPWWFGVL